MSLLAWIYSFFLPHCIVIVCWTADISDDMCGQTYSGDGLKEWEGRLMEGTLAFEDASLRGWPFVRLLKYISDGR